MIFPHTDALGEIEAIRQRFDPSAALLGAHVTLVFPFEDDVSVAALREHIQQVAMNVASFAFELSGVSADDAEYLFLHISSGAPRIDALHRSLYTGILANHYSADRQYEPHVTIGRMGDAGQLLAAATIAGTALPARSTAFARELSLFRLDGPDTGEVELTVQLRPMQILCPNCVLRPLVSSDAESLARHANDRGVWENLRDRFPHPYSIDDARAYIAHAAGRPVQTNFGIVVDDQAIGNISLVLGDDISRRSAEVGYWIGREFWGRGIVTEALRAITRYAFDELDLLRVFAVPFTTTTRSARVLEKAGYVLEGVMRNSAVKDGAVLDQSMYAAYREAR